MAIRSRVYIAKVSIAMAISSAAVGLLLASSVLTAGNVRAVVAVGDCEDEALLGAAAKVTGELVSRRAAVLDETQLRQRLRMPASVPPEAIAHRVERAESFIFGMKLRDAAEGIRVALEEAVLLPPGKARLDLTLRALALRAYLAEGLGRTSQVNETFRRMAELAPDLRLDQHLFTDEAIGRFERIRRELPARATAKLTIKSYPAGATTYVDGIERGSTPLTIAIIPGTHQVELTARGVHSIKHEVAVADEVTEFIDLGFEGSIVISSVVCLRPGATPETTSGSLSRLGTLLDVPELVAIRLDTSVGSHALVTASRRKVADGSIRAEARATLEAVHHPRDLAGFVSSLIGADEAPGPPPASRAERPPPLAASRPERPPPLASPSGIAPPAMAAPVQLAPGERPIAQARNLPIGISLGVAATGAAAYAAYAAWVVLDTNALLRQEFGELGYDPARAAYAAQLAELNRQAQFRAFVSAGAALLAATGAVYFVLSSESRTAWLAVDPSGQAYAGLTF